MFKEIIRRFKVELKLKDVLLWFVIGFVGVMLVFCIPMKQEINLTLIITAVGFSIVFVLLMAGTKSYGNFADEFYQSFIDRHEKKNKKTIKKKNK